MTTAGVHVHRAERADVLADALAQLLAEPAGDPFAPEVVAVPARGVERWLAQRLSHRVGAADEHTGDGVCAGVAFSSPASIVGAVLAVVAGVDPDEDPWSPARAVWPLLEVLDTDGGWSAPLLGQRERRFALARRLAGLFASYAAHRPAMVRGWLAGGAAGIAPDLAWQPALWRRLRELIGSPSPAERLPGACAALRADPGLVALPARLSLFGPTRLAADELAVLAALGHHRAVHLWLPHPSPALWAAVGAGRAGPGVSTREADPSAASVAHPLLASLGRDVRELQLRLADAVPDAVGHHHARADPAPTLLGRLQLDLRDDRAPDGSFVPLPDDSSITVHACHGPDRQVEVLREIVLGLLAADATLEPRDILVMCPDIETFAPLISASFALGEHTVASHPAQALAVRLADRALRQVNPVIDVVARLLELADARLTAAQVLDLLAAGPVRLRFGLDDDDLDRLRELAGRSGVRWGTDAAQREPYRLAGFAQNTWSAGLDRLLLGVATTGEGWLGTALALDEVEPADTIRLGRLAEFVDRLARVLGALADEQPLAAWVAALGEALELLTDTAPADAWQSAQARGELAATAHTAGEHAERIPLALADVRALLAERLRGRPTRANFRTGTLTVATLVPMRSVPHRVVCLLGLDDDTFPRAAAVDGDDVLARRPLVGERDVRAEDRQLLLDAVGAATERLVVVHSGADARTGGRRPPAVPLGELLDTIAATAPGVDVVTRHPLQPFDARNFAADRPFSFDRTELRGARAAARPRTQPRPFLTTPLPPLAPPPTGVLLDDLVTFLEHPVKGFLRQRIGLSLFTAETGTADALPVELDPLATWAVGDRLLRDRLAGRPLDACRQAEWRRGELPPGALGTSLLTQVIDDVEPLVAAAAGYGAGRRSGVADRPIDENPVDDLDVDVELPGGGRLVGTLAGLRRSPEGEGRGGALVRVDYSRLRPKLRLRAWVRLLALIAATGGPWRAVTIGRGLRFGRAVAEIAPVEPARALTLLAELVGLRAAGLCAPLPLATETGHAYAHCRRGGGSADEALAEAVRTWSVGAGAERDDDAHVRVWGPAALASVLTAQPGPPGGEPTRFGHLAVTLWEPLLAAEEVTRR